MYCCLFHSVRREEELFDLFYLTCRAMGNDKRETALRKNSLFCFISFGVGRGKSFRGLFLGFCWAGELCTGNLQGV